MKSLLLILTTFLFIGTLVSCNNKKPGNKNNDADNVIVYTIKLKTQNTNISAVIEYTDEKGAMASGTFDLPATITNTNTKLKSYAVKGYLKTKDGSNYNGTLEYSVSISEDNKNAGTQNALAFSSSTRGTLVEATPEQLKTIATISTEWKEPVK